MQNNRTRRRKMGRMIEYHGFKLDITGLGSVLTAMAALVLAIRGVKKKEDRKNAGKKDE